MWYKAGRLGMFWSALKRQVVCDEAGGAQVNHLDLTPAFMGLQLISGVQRHVE
jgi:hypothetical protein